MSVRAGIPSAALHPLDGSLPALDSSLCCLPGWFIRVSVPLCAEKPAEWSLPLSGWWIRRSCLIFPTVLVLISDSKMIFKISWMLIHWRFFFFFPLIHIVPTMPPQITACSCLLPVTHLQASSQLCFLFFSSHIFRPFSCSRCSSGYVWKMGMRTPPLGSFYDGGECSVRGGVPGSTAHPRPHPFPPPCSGPTGKLLHDGRCEFLSLFPSATQAHFLFLMFFYVDSVFSMLRGEVREPHPWAEGSILPLWPPLWSFPRLKLSTWKHWRVWEMIGRQTQWRLTGSSLFGFI